MHGIRQPEWWHHNLLGRKDVLSNYLILSSLSPSSGKGRHGYKTNSWWSRCSDEASGAVEFPEWRLAVHLLFSWVLCFFSLSLWDRRSFLQQWISNRFLLRDNISIPWVTYIYSCFSQLSKKYYNIVSPAVPRHFPHSSVTSNSCMKRWVRKVCCNK